MSLAQQFIKKLPVAAQVKAVKFLYRRRGKKMDDMKVLHNGRFYIYKVDGIYVPSEALGWFFTYDYYLDWVDTLSAAFYQPKPSDVILDIGAGMGEEAVVFSRKIGQQGKVYCIEANPVVFSVLEEVVRLNGLNNVSLHNVAVIGENGDVVLEDDNETFLSGSITTKKEVHSKNQYMVEGLRLDSFVEKYKISVVDLLKVNIEGAERFVIESMDDVISRIRNVAISCHDFRFRNEGGNEFFKTKDLVIEYLQDNGFIIHSLHTGIEHKDDWVFGKNSR